MIVLAAPALACAADRRIELASVVARRDVASQEGETLHAAVLDHAARRLFSSLRTAHDWGPAHPAWVRNFAEFRAGYGTLIARHTSTAVIDQLASALARGMSEGELQDVIAFQGDARSERIAAGLRALGVDMASMMRMIGMAGEPQLYTQDEQQEMKRKMSALQGREAEMRALKSEIDELSQAMSRPALVKYHAILRDTLLPSLERAASDAALQAPLAEFLQSWKGRVR